MMKKIMSNAEAEWFKERKFRKQQREFASFVIGFINLYSDNPMKHSYTNTPRRHSYMVSSLSQL